jgi:hypothetical protein
MSKNTPALLNQTKLEFLGEFRAGIGCENLPVHEVFQVLDVFGLEGLHDKSAF